MAYLSLNKNSFANFERRFSNLGEQSVRLWGSMTAQQMLNHLRQFLELTLGERTIADYSNWFTRRAIVHWLMITVPWPKGRINPPMKMLDDNLLPFADEHAKLIQAMERFVEEVERDSQRLVASPILGPVTMRYWSQIQGKHLDHHLRQFGC